MDEQKEIEELDKYISGVIIDFTGDDSPELVNRIKNYLIEKGYRKSPSSGLEPLDEKDIRADGKPYLISDYRAKTIMEDFARAVSRHGFSAGGRIESFVQSVINWKNDCLRFGRPKLEPLDEYSVHHALHGHALNNGDTSFDGVSKMLCKKFGRPKGLSVEEIDLILEKYQVFECMGTSAGYEKQRKGLAQALKNVMEGK